LTKKELSNILVQVALHKKGFNMKDKERNRFKDILPINPRTGKNYRVLDFCNEFGIPRSTFYYFMGHDIYTISKATEVADFIEKQSGLSLHFHYKHLIDEKKTEVDNLAEKATTSQKTSK
jgi:hypothetical protein